MNCPIFRKNTLLSLALLLASCSSAGPAAHNAAVGGVAGTAVGAGTGAIVGATISNGAVAESALLGGAIGLPLGILAGVAYTNYSENAAISENGEAIRANRQHLLQQERELEYLRNEMRDDSSSKTVDPDFDDIEHQYLGPSLGNSHRP